jgi:diacylglycerol kinase
MIIQKEIAGKKFVTMLKARAASFGFAWEGIVHFFRYGIHARVHFAAALVVSGASFYFHISRSEATAVIFSIALVWITEMINTAIEKTADMISLERHPQIKIIKDISAGAVLIAAVAALCAGAIIFLPKLF